MQIYAQQKMNAYTFQKYRKVEVKKDFQNGIWLGGLLENVNLISLKIIKFVEFPTNDFTAWEGGGLAGGNGSRTTGREVICQLNSRHPNF